MQQKMKSRSFLIALAAAIVVGASLFFMKGFFFPDPSREIVYHTEAAHRGSIEVSVNGIGQISAAQLVTVGAQVSGKIEKIHVKLGGKVRQGDLIAEIDDTTQVSELATREARLHTYKAQLRNHTLTASIAASQYQREKQLFARKSTSKQDYEAAEKEYSRAWAELEATKSLITQEEVAIAKAKADLGYTRIVAPMAGTIVALPVEVGQTVNANQTTPTIALLADLSRMEVKVQISEGDITKVAENMPVTFYILSEPETVFTSTFYSIDPADTDLTDEADAGRSDSASGRGAVYYYGRMLIANPDGKLRIGMTTHCTIAIARRDNVLRIPSVALKEDDKGEYVYVLEGEEPSRRYIKTGLFDSLYTEVKSGLREGEQVVTARISRAEIDAQIKKRQR